MKKIYLVRHGQGEHNLKKLFTTPNFNLTDKGKKQAEILARRLSNFPIEIILSSPYIADKPRLTLLTAVIKELFKLRKLIRPD